MGENGYESGKSEPEMVIISLDDYKKLVEIRIRFKILAEHIRHVLTSNGSRYDYEQGLFRAVLNIPEEKAGETT